MLEHLQACTTRFPWDCSRLISTTHLKIVIITSRCWCPLQLIIFCISVFYSPSFGFLRTAHNTLNGWIYMINKFV